MHWTQIDEHAVSGVTVLKLEGHMTLDGQENRLRDTVTDLMAIGRVKIVLDLAAVPYIDSVGIGEIVRVYSALLRAGGSLRLAGVTRRVRDLLEATQLTRVLGVSDTVDEAVRQLASPATP